MINIILFIIIMSSIMLIMLHVNGGEVTHTFVILNINYNFMINDLMYHRVLI